MKSNKLLFDWKDNILNELYSNKDELNKHMDNFDVKVIYWSCDVYSCVEVKREREWFKKQLPLIKDFWDEVLEKRKSQHFQKLEKEKLEKQKKKKNICLIETSSDDENNNKSFNININKCTHIQKKRKKKRKNV